MFQFILRIKASLRSDVWFPIIHTTPKKEAPTGSLPRLNSYLRMLWWKLCYYTVLLLSILKRSNKTQVTEKKIHLQDLGASHVCILQPTEHTSSQPLLSTTVFASSAPESSRCSVEELRPVSHYDVKNWFQGNKFTTTLSFRWLYTNESIIAYLKDHFTSIINIVLCIKGLHLHFVVQPCVSEWHFSSVFLGNSEKLHPRPSRDYFWLVCHNFLITFHFCTGECRFLSHNISSVMTESMCLQEHVCKHAHS